MISKESKNFLINMLNGYSPSGYEDYNNNNSVCIFENYLNDEDGVIHEFHDVHGNSCFSAGSKDPSIRLLISGHVDEIGMLVQSIDDDGFIHFIRNGGIDPKVIVGSRVSIIKRDGIVHGVIGKKAIHLEKGDERDKSIKLTDMKIDIGCRNKDEAKALVSVGDPIIVDGEFMELANNNFVSRALDDKVGVFVVAEVLKAVAELDLKKVRVYGACCGCEEVDGSGAVAITKHINPTHSIDYDVHFATDDGNAKSSEFGDVKLGRGAAISHGPDKDYGFVNTIIEACKENMIPYQEFAIGSGGTNTIHIKKTAFDCKTVLISLPNLNMHQPVEMCNYKDLQSAIDMTIAAIQELDK